MDESRHDEEQEQAVAKETPRRRAANPSRRGGTPVEPVERAVVTPPERR